MKKGISLVALVITIIVLIILTAAIILTATNTNIFGKSEEAVFKNNVSSFQEELTKKILEKQLEDNTFDRTSIKGTVYGVDDTNITYWIPSIVGTGYEDKFEIQYGQLVFVGEDKNERIYAENLGLTLGQSHQSGNGNSTLPSSASDEPLNTPTEPFAGKLYIKIDQENSSADVLVFDLDNDIFAIYKLEGLSFKSGNISKCASVERSTLESYSNWFQEADKSDDDEYFIAYMEDMNVSIDSICDIVLVDVIENEDEYVTRYNYFTNDYDTFVFGGDSYNATTNSAVSKAIDKYSW